MKLSRRAKKKQNIILVFSYLYIFIRYFNKMQSNAAHKLNSHWLKKLIKCSFWEKDDDDDDDADEERGGGGKEKARKKFGFMCPCPRLRRQVHYLVIMWNFVMTIYAMDGSFKTALCLCIRAKIYGLFGGRAPISLKHAFLYLRLLSLVTKYNWTFFCDIHTVTLKENYVQFFFCISFLRYGLIDGCSSFIHCLKN